MALYRNHDDDVSPDRKARDSGDADCESHDGIAQASRARKEAPEFIKNLSAEERTTLEKKLVRKIDLRLLPMIIIMYIMNYLDRNNIASAKIAGLQKDLALSESQYQVCVPSVRCAKRG